MIDYIVRTHVRTDLVCRLFCHDNLKYTEILQAHFHIHNTITLANFAQPIGDLHKMLMLELQEILSVDPLSSQHILSILSLSKIIKHTYYVTNAILCPVNRTKTMFWEHYGLNENTMNIYYKKNADEHFNSQTAISENLGCEFIRDMYRNKNIPELINQELYNQNWKKRSYGSLILPLDRSSYIKLSQMAI